MRTSEDATVNVTRNLDAEDRRDAAITKARALASMLSVIHTEALNDEMNGYVPSDLSLDIRSGVMWALSDLLDEAEKAKMDAIRTEGGNER